jgi:hypothetical protein
VPSVRAGRCKPRRTGQSRVNHVTEDISEQQQATRSVRSSRHHDQREDRLLFWTLAHGNPCSDDRSVPGQRTGLERARSARRGVGPARRGRQAHRLRRVLAIGSLPRWPIAQPAGTWHWVARAIGHRAGLSRRSDQRITPASAQRELRCKRGQPSPAGPATTEDQVPTASISPTVRSTSATATAHWCAVDQAEASRLRRTTGHVSRLSRTVALKEACSSATCSATATLSV